MKKKIFTFLSSPKGRVIRVIIGMIFLAFGFEKNPIWLVVGIIPLIAGVFDYCVFAPLFGLPFLGKRLREVLKKVD